MYIDQKSTQVRQPVRQRQMTRSGDTWHLDMQAETEAKTNSKPTRSVFASVNGYAQAEVVTTIRKSA